MQSVSGIATKARLGLWAGGHQGAMGDAREVGIILQWITMELAQAIDKRISMIQVSKDVDESYGRVLEEALVSFTQTHRKPSSFSEEELLSLL